MARTRMYYSEEAERIAKRQRLISGVIYSAVGIVVGGLLALLLAPREQPKKRMLLSRKTGNGFSGGRDMTSDALKRLEQEYNNLRDQVDKIVGSVKN